jgi:hypothetical protein
LGEAIAFIGEIILRVVFEAIFEGLFYGVKKIWYWITGREERAQMAFDRHRKAQDARRQRVEQIRHKRRRKKKR